MPKVFRPTLAAKTDHMKEAAWVNQFGRASIGYLLASSKIDGIRCILHPERGPITRSGKPIANAFIRQSLIDQANEYSLWGLDGEICAVPQNKADKSKPAPIETPFNITSSCVMSHGGEPYFTLYAFDTMVMIDIDPDLPFEIRLNMVDQSIRKVPTNNFAFVPHETILDVQQLFDRHEQDVSRMLEGTMVRDPLGIYKQGRSTVNQGILLKLKPFGDAEGEIIGWEPLKRNLNAAYLNDVGYTKRSSSQEGKVADDSMLGRFRLKVVTGEFKGVEIWCGSGLDEAQRIKYRGCIDELVANKALVSFKYQPHGSVDAPRTPIFKGLRSRDDL